MFSSLQHLEGVADPVPVIQGVLQTGQELKPLRDELFCQLIKQTTRPPQPGGPGNLCGWKILACMSCTFIPTRSILRYLKFHLKRYDPGRVGSNPHTFLCTDIKTTVPTGPGSSPPARRWIATPPSPWTP